MTGEQDGELLQRVGAGDAAAYRALVERHMPALLRLARRMLRDDAEAEDVTQDALLRLWRGAKSIEVGTNGVKPWLWRVTSNICIDRMRAKRASAGEDELPDIEIAATQHHRLEQQDLARQVDASLKTLPERQRLALVLFHYQGLTQNEVAEAMEISAEAVESLLARARRTVKGLLADEWKSLLPEAADEI